MAVVRIPETGEVFRDEAGVRRALAAIDIEYEHWEASRTVADGAPAAEILEAYSEEIEALKKRGGYVTADVIDVTRATPNLDVMLAKFSREHWHDEDEVRFIVKGRGIFHIHPRGGRVHAIEVAAGDLIRVPRGTWHWFDLCESREIRAIRLFQDAAGWTPNYTDSAVDKGFQPVCLGPTQIPGRAAS
jgi:1,2-dihydroxy-3-keto-5-methylthiopentene dioxygenase